MGCARTFISLKVFSTVVVVVVDITYETWRIQNNKKEVDAFFWWFSPPLSLSLSLFITSFFCGWIVCVVSNTRSIWKKTKVKLWAQEIFRFWSMRNAKRRSEKPKAFLKMFFFSSKEVGSSIPLDCLLLIFFFVTWLYNIELDSQKKTLTPHTPNKIQQTNKKKSYRFHFKLLYNWSLSLVLKIFFSPFIHSFIWMAKEEDEKKAPMNNPIRKKSGLTMEIEREGN